jgi:hypothetical protein
MVAHSMPRLWTFLAFFLVAHAEAEEPFVHGLWVWKTPSILAAPGGEEALRDFCQAEGIGEIYLSTPSRGFDALAVRLPALIRRLHAAHIRVEALLDSIDADLPGKPREKLLAQVEEIVRFDADHPTDRFDGIHLDIEPQQRPENKGPGNLKCLPGLVETFRAVRALAEPAGLTTNADIPNKFLKGDAGQRRMLLSSVPRLTLMLYELSSPQDGRSTPQKIEKLRNLSRHYLALTYAGLNDPNLAPMAIGLRTPDYLQLLPAMLHSLDPAHRDHPRYLGWAWHSYNDRVVAE